MQDLNQLCQLLNDDYDINRGGCCYITYLIAKNLDRLHIPYKLVIFDRYPKDIKAIKKELYKQRFHRTYYKSVTGIHSCSHYCLQIGENLINASDYFEFYKYVISDINAKHILWIYKHGVWNNNYDVRNNLTVKRIINNYFKNEEKTR